MARHPNLVALELSSFKCGHDAPIYSVVEEIVEHSGTPYFCFKDIDENKPTGSIRIRVETIGYFLKRYREDMVRNKQKANNIDEQLKEFEAKLRRQMLRDRMDDSRVQESFEHGSMPQIHVSIGALAASNPPAARSAGIKSLRVRTDDARPLRWPGIFWIEYRADSDILAAMPPSATCVKCGPPSVKVRVMDVPIRGFDLRLRVDADPDATCSRETHVRWKPRLRPVRLYRVLRHRSRHFFAAWRRSRNPRKDNHAITSSCSAPSRARRPKHRGVDNPRVRILNAMDPPHRNTALHKHDVNRVMIYLDNADQDISHPDAPTEHFHWKAGDVAWSPPAACTSARMSAPATCASSKSKSNSPHRQTRNLTPW